MAPQETPIRFSVLDQAPTRTGISPAQSIREVVDLARHAEDLGFHRFWIAEHHAIGAVASTAPEALIGLIAAQTEALRIGSGGVLLPNHRPIHVAEIFATLAALAPGRIDLGVGRSEGSLNPAVVKAFGRPENSTHAGGYEQMLDELLAFAGLTHHPEDSAFTNLVAGPDGESFPPIFMLGSSSSSAATAAARGLGYAFAAYTGPDALVDALATYRENFRPGPQRERPHAILGLKVMVGENNEHATALNAPGVLAQARSRIGRPGPLLDVEAALAHQWSEAEREGASKVDTRMDVIGDPAEVADQIAGLVAQTGADEVIVTSNTPDPAERRASYARLAAAVGLSRDTASAITSGRLQKAKRTSVAPASSLS